MGKILYLTCDKNEEHEHRFFVGIGMMFPSLYKKIIKKIQQGKYGTGIKNFLEGNPKRVINCSSEIAYCSKCGSLEEVVNLSMYVPKKNNQTVDISYVMPSELKRKYKKIKGYKHICSKCSTEMKKVKIEEDDCGEIIKIKKLKCPKCDGVLKWNGDCNFWD